jgi:hypothetical protein
MTSFPSDAVTWQASWVAVSPIVQADGPGDTVALAGRRLGATVVAATGPAVASEPEASMTRRTGTGDDISLIGHRA